MRRQSESVNWRKETREIFITLFVATCATQIGMGIISPILPLYADTFSANALSIGLVFAAFAFARTFLAPLVGRMSDRVDRRKVILVGLVGYVAVSFLYTLATSLWHLGFLRFLQGAAAVMVTPIAQAYIGDLTPKGKEGRYLSLFYSSMFIGMAMGPIIGGGLTELWSYNAAFLTMAVLSLAALGLVAAILPKSTHPKAQRSSEGKKAVGISELIKNDAVKAISIYWITRGFWRQGFNTFYPLFAAGVGGLGEASIGLVLTVHLLGGGLLQIPFGWLADRYPRFPQIVIGSTLAPLAMIPILFVKQTWVVILVAFLMGAFGALARAAILATRVELGREHGMGMMAGLQSGAFGAGQMFGPLVCGVLVDLVGVKSVFPFGASVGILGTVLLVIWLCRWSKQRSGF